MPLNKQNRIWELDAFRGICILGMVTVHLVYDLVEVSGLLKWEYSPLFSFIMNWGGVLFLMLSGICATLGSGRPKRGLLVLGCGMLVTAVTAGMYRLGLADSSMVIRFGVLHCLGICMLAWLLLKRLPNGILVPLAAAIIIAGLAIQNLRVETPWLFWLGFVTTGFSSADFFPLMPFLGFFLLGAALGRSIYVAKTSRFPNADPRHPTLRFLTALGRWSLPIYLGHQPVIFLLTGLLSRLF